MKDLPQLSQKTQDYISFERKYDAHYYAPLPVVLEKGEGVWLYDIDGNKYLDMISAYSAVSHGHCHPELVDALSQQAKKLAVTSRALYNTSLAPLLEKLCKISGLDRALPMNTGAEAVETALKLARRWGYRVKKIPDGKAEVIVASNNFHGRTITLISFSTEYLYKNDFGPYTPGFTTVKYGDAQALQSAINENTCAFLIEPMQGEAGILLPPKGWLRDVREICDKNNILLILDEIQTGLSRTGKTFAFQHEDILPDALILGKSLGGGLLPVSAVIAKNEVMETFDIGSHGSTFGGNPLATTVALKAIEIMERDQYAKRSHELGNYLMEKIKEIKTSLIKEIRGSGLWIGIELHTERVMAHDVCVKLLQKGVISKEARRGVIRLAPPLVIEKDQLDFAIEKLQEALSELE